MLLKGSLAVREAGQLRVGGGIHRQQESVLLLQGLGVAIHGDAIAIQELLQLLAMALVHVRLIHNDESIGDVHGHAAEVLAEDDLHRGSCSLSIESVFLGLGVQLCVI